MELLRKLLFPFSLIYGLITGMRNYLYNYGVLKSNQFKTPTIVVGNLSVGGTGKTPQIEYLVRLLCNDYKVAVLSRGYKRKSKGFLLAEEGVRAKEIGDEPFQYYKKFKNILVAVDADRTNGIQYLEKLEDPPEVILLDDAFQHRKVKGGFAILLTSYNDLYVDDHMLPSGNLRENISGAKRASVIIVTKCPDKLSEESQAEIISKLKPKRNQTVFFTTIGYDTDLKGGQKLNLSELVNREVLLLTGIANPKPLTKFLTINNVKFEHLRYPDHYNFNSQDIKQINKKREGVSSKEKVVLTTEKDYVRIFDKIEDLHYISIETKFINRKKDFNNLIKAYVEQSSKHR